MPTKQETFNESVNHLRRQGCKSVSPKDPNRCLYRGPNNTKCAAGIFISDEDYRESLEDRTVMFLSNRGFFLGHDLGLLCDLQGCHDQRKVNEWEEQFQIIARDHSLEYYPPENLQSAD